VVIVHRIRGQQHGAGEGFDAHHELSGRMPANLDEPDAGSEFDLPLNGSHATRPIRGEERVDLGAFGESGELTTLTEVARPQVEVSPSGIDRRAIEGCEVSDVVVVD